MYRLQNGPHRVVHVFSVQGWRWSAIQQYCVCHVLTYVLSFNAGTRVVSGGECPDDGSANPDVKGDGRDLTNLAQRRIKPHGVVSDSRGRRLMEKSRFPQDP